MNARLLSFIRPIGMALLIGMLGACSRPTPLPMFPVPSSVNLSPTLTAKLPLPATPSLQPYPPFAYPPAEMTRLASLPTNTPWPTPTNEPTTTPYPTPLPPPTLIPTIDPTLLPDLLREAFRVEDLGSVNGHELKRITGWAYGLRSSHYCAEGPYRWLDDRHLMFLPLTGEEESIVHYEYTWPVVTDWKVGQSWFPSSIGHIVGCSQPMWSEPLQTLIVVTNIATILYRPDGQVANRFEGGARESWTPYLSPSGRRLFTNPVWQDLETGRQVEFSQGSQLHFVSPAWSYDESRLFSCCYLLVDANSGEYVDLGLTDSLQQLGRDSCPPSGCLVARWVLNDTRAMIEWDFNGGIIPLIDPINRAYEDIRRLAGLDATVPCGIPSIAPNGNHILARCVEAVSPLTSGFHPKRASVAEGSSWRAQFLIDLRTFVTYTLPSGFSFVGWSPDSRFALLTQGQTIDALSGEYALISVSNGEVSSIAGTPVRALNWSPSGQWLAYLSDNGQTLITLEAATHASRVVLLPQSFASVVWNPSGNSLAVVAEDGSVWLAHPATGLAEQLTPPLPNVRDVKWSPSGSHLAFVSDTDVYVVAVTE